MPDVSFRVRLFHIYPMNFLHIMTTTLALTAAAPQQSPAETPMIGKNEIQLKNDRMTPEALWAMGRIGNMTTSPDGKKIAYTVTYYSVQQNKSCILTACIGRQQHPGCRVLGIGQFLKRLCFCLYGDGRA